MSEPESRRALIAWYAASVGSISLQPWLAVLLTGAGWASSTASLLLLGLPIGRLVGGPLWAFLADRYRPEPIVRGAAILGLVAASALLLAGSKLLVAAAILTWAVSRAPLFPVVDATTVALVGRDYGRIRAVGSLGFLLAALLGGALRDRLPLAPVGLCVALCAGSAWATFRLPPLLGTRARPRPRDTLRLLRDPVLVGFAVAGTLHGAGLAIYDHLYAVRVQSLGLPSLVVGLSLACGVAVEVTVMLRGRDLLRRIRPETLLVLSMAAGVPRLWLTGVSTSPVVLVLLQGLHGVHFGAFWLAATALLAERAPAELRHTTQALLPSAAFGAGPILGLGLASTILGPTATGASTGALFELGALLAAGATFVGWRTLTKPPPASDESCCR